METALEGLNTDAYKEAAKLLDEAKNGENFHFNHANQVISTGERTVDYVLYCFDLPDETYLLVDFVDFSFESFSIVSKGHLEALQRTLD